MTEVRGDEVTVDLPEGAVGRATTLTVHGEYADSTCPILKTMLAHMTTQLLSEEHAH